MPTAKASTMGHPQKQHSQCSNNGGGHIQNGNSSTRYGQIVIENNDYSLMTGKPGESIKGPGDLAAVQPLSTPQQQQQLLPAVVALQTEVGSFEGDLTVKVTSSALGRQQSTKKKESNKYDQISHSVSWHNRTPVRHVSL